MSRRRRRSLRRFPALALAATCATSLAVAGPAAARVADNGPAGGTPAASVAPRFHPFADTSRPAPAVAAQTHVSDTSRPVPGAPVPLVVPVLRTVVQHENANQTLAISLAGGALLLAIAGMGLTALRGRTPRPQVRAPQAA